jgi:hypothetical protein
MVALGRWRLFWWFERPKPQAELLRWNNSAAALWVGGFRRRNDALPVFRRLLAQHHVTDEWRSGDDGLIRLVTDAVARDRLLVYEWRPQREGGGTNPEETQTLAPAFPLEERRVASSSQEQAPDTPLFPDDAELVAIAGVLKSASEAGIPFCEECAKAAAARKGSA